MNRETFLTRGEPVLMCLQQKYNWKRTKNCPRSINVTEFDDLKMVTLRQQLS